jgi:sec-independent protein translocase protein TatA
MVPLQLFGSLGGQELVVILLLALVLFFGARRIPELARGLGEGIRGFRSALRGESGPPPDKSETGRRNGPQQP